MALEIRVGNHTYCAAQIEKCVPAIVAALGHLDARVKLMVQHSVTRRHLSWWAEIWIDDHAMCGGGPQPSPWKALYGAVLIHRDQLHERGIEVAE